MSITLSNTSEPLVSCVMPTAGRAGFIAQAIYHFGAQRYPRKELLIVYDKASDLPEGLVLPPGVRTVRSSGTSIGAKRNDGCRHAAGGIIAQWDDDDIYHPDRLCRQVEPLTAGRADITALRDTLFFEQNTGLCWSATPELFAQLFYRRVVGGTLVFRRSIWENRVRYRTVSLREDAEFLKESLLAGARLSAVYGRDLFIYRRHDMNTWRFAAGRYLDPAGWKKEPVPGWVPDFCRTQAPTETTKTPPAVSCIMPTADRGNFIVRAVHCFLLQDYAHKELVILDDGAEPVARLIPDHPDIRYVRRAGKGNIGAKRNEACRLSKGQIIMHWDDDDWYAPDWISRQVACMQQTGADICGLDRVLFYDRRSAKAWKYTYPEHGPAWVAGATMAYRRSLWETHPFKEVQIGEDNGFVWGSGGKVVPHAYLHGFVSFLHAGNTSPKHIHPTRWKDFPVKTVEEILR